MIQKNFQKKNELNVTLYENKLKLMAFTAKVVIDQKKNGVIIIYIRKIVWPN